MPSCPSLRDSISPRFRSRILSLGTRAKINDAKRAAKLEMCNQLLLMLLTAMSTSATAEWVAVARTYNAVVYVDPATISRSGGIVTMWDLTDYKQPQVSFQGKPFSSDSAQTQYDCATSRRRLLYFSFYSRSMGGGEIVYSDANAHEWRLTPPDTIAETLSRFACGEH